MLDKKSKKKFRPPCSVLSPDEELALVDLIETEHADELETQPAMARLRRKLLLNQVRRERGLPLFDIDARVTRLNERIKRSDQQYTIYVEENEQTTPPANQPPVRPAAARAYEAIAAQAAAAAAASSSSSHHHQQPSPRGISPRGISPRGPSPRASSSSSLSASIASPRGRSSRSLAAQAAAQAASTASSSSAAAAPAPASAPAAERAAPSPPPKRPASPPPPPTVKLIPLGRGVYPWVPVHGAFESTLLGGWHTEPSYVVAGATGRVLKPYIRRDSETRPRHVALLEELVATARRLGTARDVAGPYQRAPIDYCHLQPHLVPQANRLLSEVLWPNIDTSEAAAAFPELTAVALYRKRVIGCAVMTNRGYVLYLGVDPHWRRSGVASFLLYSILQLCPARDATAHAGADNGAGAAFLQRFGFRAERFVVDYYRKQWQLGNVACRHGLFFRLRGAGRGPQPPPGASLPPSGSPAPSGRPSPNPSPPAAMMRARSSPIPAAQ